MVVAVNEGWIEKVVCEWASAPEACRNKELHKAAYEEFVIVASRHYEVLGVEGRTAHRLLRRAVEGH